jgi:hypothetical protein
MNKRDLRSGFELLEAGFLPSSVELVGIAKHAIERALEAEAKLEKAKGLIQRWFDGEISAFGVMDAMIIDLEFDIDGIPDEALEYHNIKRKKEVLGDET